MWVLKCLYKDQKHQWYQSYEQHLEFFWRDSNYFLSRLVTMDETWLYHHEPHTKQQSMVWWHSGSPCPKKFLVQKSAGKDVTLTFLGSRRHPPELLFSKGPNYQRRVLLISAGAIGGHFEGKMTLEIHQGSLVIAR